MADTLVDTMAQPETGSHATPASETGWLYVRENPDRHVSYDLDTGLPVISDADMFYAFCRDPYLTDEMRHELVETAACGPMRKRSAAAAGPSVPETDWYRTILAVPELTEEQLRLLAIAIPNGPTRDLGDLTTALIGHPSASDRVVCWFLTAAACRRDHTAAPIKVPSILAALDQAEHPAAAAYRITASAPVTAGAVGVPQCDEEFFAVTGALRELGPVAARTADRLADQWNDTLEVLLETAAAVAAQADRGTAA